jgi:hypothetical protein
MHLFLVFPRIAVAVFSVKCGGFNSASHLMKEKHLNLAQVTLQQPLGVIFSCLVGKLEKHPLMSCGLLTQVSMQYDSFSVHASHNKP